MKVRINLDILLIYFEVFLIIFLSGSWKQGNFNEELDSIKWMMVFIALFCAARSFTSKYELKVFLLLLSGSVFYLLFEIKVFPPSINTFAFFLIKFILFLFFVLFAGKRNICILEVIANIVFVIAVYSLFMYIMIHIIHFDLPHITYNGHGVDYNNYFLFVTTNHPNFQSSIGGYRFSRLMSFFWEPGVYQIYLCYALFYFLFCKSGKKTSMLVVLIINILLTVSTTGICIAIFMLGYSVTQKIGLNKKTFLILAFSALIAILCIAFFWKMKMHTSSYSTRMNDFLVGLHIFKEHWIVGTGFQNHTEYIIARGNNRGSSNGLMSWFSSMGLLGGILFIIPFGIRINNIIDSKGKELYIIYFLTFIFQNMSEPITNHPFMSLIVAMECSYLLFFRKAKGSFYNYWFEESEKLYC